MNVHLNEFAKSSKKIEQKGIREFLLCNECEGKLSKYEKYAADTLYSKNKNNKAYIVSANRSDDGRQFLYNYEGFLYSHFKLFLMSIFWRLLISKEFTDIKVDEVMLEKLRIAIHSENPLEPDEFGCIVQVIKYDDGQLVSKIILSPYLTEIDDAQALNQLIDGFMFSFMFESKKLPETFKKFFLQKDGSLKIFSRLLSDDPALLKSIKKAWEFFDTTL